MDRMPGLARRFAGFGAVLALAGCGGGIWIGIEDDEWDDGRPSVSIASASTGVSAGGTLRVVAAAADENGIDDVAFYRRDGNRWTLLGRDSQDPYEWTVDVPSDGRAQLEVFARATDRAGWQADSNVLVVPVLP